MVVFEETSMSTSHERALHEQRGAGDASAAISARASAARASGAMSFLMSCAAVSVNNDELSV